jgi:O-antigen/teichoic acid export membrane protein
MWAKVLKANIAYALGSAANSAALFLLVPFLVNALAPAEYGAWAIFEIIIIFLNMLVTAGLDVGLMREYWFLKGEGERRRLVGTVLIAMCLWAGVLTVALSLVVALVWRSPAAAALPQLSFDAIVLVLAIGAVESIFALLLTLSRIREEAVRFVVLSLGRMLLFMATAILAVRSGGGVSGALAARLLAGLCGVLAAGWLARGHVALCVDWGRLRAVLRYGLPLLPASVASYILLASDRYVLQQFSTLEAVAIYSFAYKIATTLDVAVTRPFAMDWAPRRFKIATAADAPRKYAQALVLYAFVAIGFALVVAAATPAVYAWLVPPLYQAGMAVVPIILVAYIIYGLSYPLNVGIMLKDRTSALPLVSWLAAAVCLGLNLWLIPRYGMVGAAWATVLAYIVWTASIAWVSLQLYPVPYSARQISWLIIAGAAGYAGIWGVEQTAIAQSHALALIYKCVWIMLILALAGYGVRRAGWLGRAADERVPRNSEVHLPDETHLDPAAVPGAHDTVPSGARRT